jgi:hypothetical protein
MSPDGAGINSPHQALFSVDALPMSSASAERFTLIVDTTNDSRCVAPGHEIHQRL